MKAIFAVMNTTWAVVNIGPEKNSGLYGIWTPDHTGLNFFSGPIFTTAQVVFIIAKIAFIFTYLKYHWKGYNYQ